MAAAGLRPAVLEVLVRLDLPPELLPYDDLPPTIDVPDDVAAQFLDRAQPDADDCGRAGDTDRRALSLGAPGAPGAPPPLPQERNALTDVRPSDTEQLIREAAFRLDPRLL